jgi:hypothetical protein
VEELVRVVRIGATIERMDTTLGTTPLTPTEPHLRSEPPPHPAAITTLVLGVGCALTRQDAVSLAVLGAITLAFGATALSRICRWPGRWAGVGLTLGGLVLAVTVLQATAGTVALDLVELVRART